MMILTMILCASIGFLEGVDNDEKEKLECAVNNVIQSWIDKHGLNINAFLVEDVEQVKV